jgi:hypothetical protein
MQKMTLVVAHAPALHMRRARRRISRKPRLAIAVALSVLLFAARPAQHPASARVAMLHDAGSAVVAQAIKHPTSDSALVVDPRAGEHLQSP